MALSREKAKKPVKGKLLKSSKPAVKPVKLATVVKDSVLKAATAVKTTVVKAAQSKKMTAAPAIVKTAKGKTAAPQQAAAPAKGKSAQVIEKAKAALKSEKTVAEASVQAPGPAAEPAKPKAKARKISIEASANEAASALAAKWATLYKKAEQIDAKPYNMKNVFEEKTAIVHKVLGWGYILANRNDRLEVLFKDGIKHLISNYKP